ncbi:MAG: glutamine amidotransferase [Saprospiraceae bacterium]|nr:glutamine amidotransferase [Saprospiraceae bacterium]
MRILIIFFTLILLCSACQEASESTNVKYTPYLMEDAYNVAFLIMDGVYNTELTAPFDIFHHTRFRDSIKPMNVFTVAKNEDVVTSFEGIRLIPDFHYLHDSIPSIDILVIPSAEHHLDSDLEDTIMMNWVRKVAKNSEFVTSHCDGAFVLAEAGLLNNVVATTFPSDIELMRQKYPELDIRDNVLFVHDGKFITSAGGAKSFEAALYLCEYLYGKTIAQRLAEGLVIDWNLDEVAHLVVED